jgi:flagellar biosynthesis/type III secretory pathway ATPase
MKAAVVSIPKRTGTTWSLDRMTEHMVGEIVRRAGHRRHIRVAAAWVGLIADGVHKLVQGGGSWRVNYHSQLVFKTPIGNQYKVRWSHAIHAIEIVKYDGTDARVASIRSYDDAKQFMLDPRRFAPQLI